MKTILDTPCAASTATAPLVCRAPMRAQPWFGLFRGMLRGLLLALWPRGRFPAPVSEVPSWQGAARSRRSALLAVVGMLALLALGLQGLAAPDQPTLIWFMQTVLGTLLFAWVGVGFATALMGAWVMLCGDRHALALHAPHAPIDRHARTAVIMPICNEDVATVFSGLRATCESLAASGALALFDVYVLSDTSDPALRAAEMRAWQQLRDTLGDNPVRSGGRVFYRWRRHRTRRKAGNVADFCRRWGSQYRYMVVLDADSIMNGDTLVSMVRLMEQQPRAGIVQTLPQGWGAHTLHARLQLFGNRVTGRLFALGMAYWQLGESHYWGHNAILRVAPFMQHCALAPIPGRGGLAGEILSHDFVEAALMRRAGYEVWLAPQLRGSWEQHPANLLEELQRDRRWCQGNLQNARLIAEPGLRPVHRTMLAVGALSYLMAPVWLCFVVLGLWLGASAEGGSGSTLWGLTLLLLLLPRLLGVLTLFLNGEQLRFGGMARLLCSAGLELLMSAVQAPLRMLAHSVFVVSALTGLHLNWKSPSRAAASVAWRDAMRRIGTLVLPALGLLLWALHGRRSSTPHLAPLLLPLIVAVPFTVWTSQQVVGLRRAGLLSVPEDLSHGRTLARTDTRLAQREQSQAFTRGWGISTRRPVRRGFALAGFASAALLVTALAPRLAVSPVLSPELQSSQQWLALTHTAPRHRATSALTVEQASMVRPQRPEVRYRPASMIDDEVRRRAYRAVAGSLEAG